MVPGGAIVKLALATMRCVAVRALHAGRCRLSAAGDGRWGEVLKLKVVNCNNYFLLCKFFGPPTELECSTTELPAALSVMACEISCMHIEVGYLMLRRVELRLLCQQPCQW